VAKGIYAHGYYPHNVHFLLVSAQMASVISDEAVRIVLWAQPIKAAP
jgi:hypothetical protein